MVGFGSGKRAGAAAGERSAGSGSAGAAMPRTSAALAKRGATLGAALVGLQQGVRRGTPNPAQSFVSGPAIQPSVSDGERSLARLASAPSVFPQGLDDHHRLALDRPPPEAVFHRHTHRYLFPCSMSRFFTGPIRDGPPARHPLRRHDARPGHRRAGSQPRRGAGRDRRDQRRARYIQWADFRHSPEPS